MKESTVRARNNVNFAYTRGQLVIDGIIKDIGFDSEMEVEFPPYRVDIYVRSIHAAVEFDGAHSFKKRDKKRDDYLMETYNLPVFRLNFFSPKDAVKKSLIPFFKDCAMRESFR